MTHGTTNKPPADTDNDASLPKRRQSVLPQKTSSQPKIEFNPALPNLPPSTPAIALLKKGSLTLLFASLTLGTKTMRAVSNSLARGLDTVRLQLGDLLEQALTKFGRHR
ncbi:MAG: hypothetical protein LBK60_11385 [Verrucomicrobiales bacterium]|jgi:hypothetical protein|nr:hypothetical protein [Verrucomicrobiales bacterium]